MKQTFLTPHDCFHDFRESDLLEKVYPFGSQIKWRCKVSGMFVGYSSADDFTTMHFLSNENDVFRKVYVKDKKLHTTKYPRNGKYHRRAGEESLNKLFCSALHDSTSLEALFDTSCASGRVKYEMLVELESMIKKEHHFIES